MSKVKISRSWLGEEVEAACAHIPGKEEAEVSEERRGQCAAAGARNSSRLSLEKEQDPCTHWACGKHSTQTPGAGKGRRHTGSGLQQGPRIVDRIGKCKQMMETIM